jgi:putative FmdB family regulatory protein
VPIFEYTCRACDQQFETLVLSIRDKISCPRCHGDQVDKQLSVFSAPAAGVDSEPNSGACTGTPQTCGCR